MAHKSRTRRNPTGTILVNPSRKHRRSGHRKLTLRSLFGKRRNPITIGNPRRRRHSKRRNPITIGNPRRRRHSKRRNPITIGNPRKRRHAKRGHKRASARRRNPITIGNPRRRRNPGMVGGLLAKVQGLFRKIPLVGGILSAAVGGLTGALGGAIGVIPTEMALPYVARFLPAWVKPYAYTLAGTVLSGVVKALPVSFPYKAELAVGLAAAGGAVDMYRYRHGQSMTLSGDGDYGDYGDGEYGDTYQIGADDGLGDDGAPFAAAEFADADIGDYQYAGDDLSASEMAAAELGRSNFRKKFAHKKRRAQKAGQEDAKHEGEGAQWGWLIYWVGFDNFQKLVHMSADQRRAVIKDMKHMAMLRATKLLEQGVPTDMVNAEMAGVLIAA
jgi:hypothetical protein